MKTEPYTGKVSGMKTSPWLASEDLLGVGTVTMEIESINRNEEIGRAHV